MTLHVDEFLEFLAAERRLSPNTLAAYRNDLRQFEEYLDTRVRDARTDDVAGDAPSREAVAGFFLSLREDKGYSAATIARKMAAVKSLFQYLMKQSFITQNPTSELGSPEVKKPLPRAISVADVDKLIRQVDKKTTPEGLRDRAMVHLLYATGMRVSEMVTLDVGDLDLADHSVRCVGRGGRVRRLPVELRACAVLADYLQQGRPLLLRTSDGQNALFLNHRGQRLTRQGFWLIMKAVTRESGVTAEVTPHTLRHSFAAHRLSDGLALPRLRELLGHANISTTQIYTQVRVADPRPVITRPGAHPPRIPLASSRVRR
ncbi:MAG: tyrosine recombinase [Chloroflexota bacterium]